MNAFSDFLGMRNVLQGLWQDGFNLPFFKVLLCSSNLVELRSSLEKLWNIGLPKWIWWRMLHNCNLLGQGCIFSPEIIEIVEKLYHFNVRWVQFSTTKLNNLTVFRCPKECKCKKTNMWTSKQSAWGNTDALKTHRTDVSGGRETGLFQGKTPSCSKRPRRPQDRVTQLASHNEPTRWGGCLYKLIKHNPASNAIV